MAENDQAQAQAKQEAERREAEQKRLREQQAQQQAKTQETPTPTQAENDKAKENKERADKSAKEVEARTAKFYDYPDPTPTQAENDAAMLGAMNQQELPEGSGLYTTPSNLPEEQHRRKLEGDKAGGYKTR